MRKSLSTSLTEHCCVFSDILEIWGPDHASLHEAIMNTDSFDKKLCLAQNLPRATHGYCHTHDGLCPYASGAKVRVQGAPCPDFSNAGKRLGVQGPRLPPLLAAGCKADALQTPVVVLENVPGFPLWLAEAVYGPRYSWYGMLQDPSMVGFEFMSRSRWLSCTCISTQRLG